MHEKIDLNNLLLAVIFSAMGITFPILFHLFGLGKIFLPMYIPLCIGAFFLVWNNAVLIGVFTPLVSALITGMPPFYPPIAFLMMVQLGIFCFAISYCTHKTKIGIIPTLLIAVLLDRLVMVLLYYLIIPMFKINFGLYTVYDLAKGVPGIILMFVITPVLVPRLKQFIGRHSLTLYDHKEEVHHD